MEECMFNLSPLFLAHPSLNVQLLQGAPVDLAPPFDDTELGADPTRNNNFTFVHPDSPCHGPNEVCPTLNYILRCYSNVDALSLRTSARRAPVLI